MSCLSLSEIVSARHTTRLHCRRPDQAGHLLSALASCFRASGAAVSFNLPLAPFLVFDGLFFDRVELVETDQSLDVVPRRDAFFVAEAGKVPGGLQLFERALIEMKTDEQLQLRIERNFVTHVGVLGRGCHRPVVAVAAADDIDERDLG